MIMIRRPDAFLLAPISFPINDMGPLSIDEIRNSSWSLKIWKWLWFNDATKYYHKRANRRESKHTLADRSQNQFDVIESITIQNVLMIISNYLLISAVIIRSYSLQSHWIEI